MSSWVAPKDVKSSGWIENMYDPDVIHAFLDFFCVSYCWPKGQTTGFWLVEKSKEIFDWDNNFGHFPPGNICFNAKFWEISEWNFID